jgi:hypothetical protein
MTPEEFLQQLNPHSRVFDLSIDYKYTEDQLVLFAKLYHESELKKLRVADVSRCFGEDDLRHVYEDIDTNYQSFEDWFKVYTSPI